MISCVLCRIGVAMALARAGHSYDLAKRVIDTEEA
jgi:hypothetical protein